MFDVMLQLGRCFKGRFPQLVSVQAGVLIHISRTHLKVFIPKSCLRASVVIVLVNSFSPILSAAKSTPEYPLSIAIHAECLLSSTSINAEGSLYLQFMKHLGFYEDD